jgi:hypothetical protein
MSNPDVQQIKKMCVCTTPALTFTIEGIEICPKCAISNIKELEEKVSNLTSSTPKPEEKAAAEKKPYPPRDKKLIDILDEFIVISYRNTLLDILGARKYDDLPIDEYYRLNMLVNTVNKCIIDCEGMFSLERVNKLLEVFNVGKDAHTRYVCVNQDMGLCGPIEICGQAGTSIAVPPGMFRHFPLKRSASTWHTIPFVDDLLKTKRAGGLDAVNEKLVKYNDALKYVNPMIYKDIWPATNIGEYVPKDNSE